MELRSSNEILRAAWGRFAGRSSAAEVVGLSAVILALGGAPARSQPRPHDVGIFSDADATQSTLEVQSFTPFNVYAIAFELDGQVKGWEMKFEFPVQFTVLTFTPNPNNCLGCFYTLSDLVVGTGGCFEGIPSYRLFTVNFGWFGSGEVPSDATFCVRPRDTTAPALEGHPGYLQCDGDLVPFGYAQNGGEFYPDGCLVVNPTHPLEGPVDVEGLGMGALKSRFGTQPQRE